MNNLFKKLLWLLLAATMLVGVVSCSDDDDDDDPVVRINDTVTSGDSTYTVKTSDGNFTITTEINKKLTTVAKGTVAFTPAADDKSNPKATFTVTSKLKADGTGMETVTTGNVTSALEYTASDKKFTSGAKTTLGTFIATLLSSGPSQKTLVCVVPEGKTSITITGSEAVTVTLSATLNGETTTDVTYEVTDAATTNKATISGSTLTIPNAHATGKITVIAKGKKDTATAELTSATVEISITAKGSNPPETKKDIAKLEVTPSAAATVGENTKGTDKVEVKNNDNIFIGTASTTLTFAATKATADSGTPTFTYAFKKGTVSGTTTTYADITSDDAALGASDAVLTVKAVPASDVLVQVTVSATGYNDKVYNLTIKKEVLKATYTYDLDNGTNGIITIETEGGDASGAWSAHLKNTKESDDTDITMATGTYTGDPTAVTGTGTGDNKVALTLTKVVKDFDAIREGHTPAEGDLADPENDKKGPISITIAKDNTDNKLYIDSKAGSKSGASEGTSWKGIMTALYAKIDAAGGVPSEHIEMLEANTGINGLDDLPWKGIQIHNLDAGSLERKVLNKGMADLVDKNGNASEAKITFRMVKTGDATKVYVYGKLKNIGTAWTDFGGSNNTGHFVPMIFSMAGTSSIKAMKGYILDGDNKVQSGPGSKVLDLTQQNASITGGGDSDPFTMASGLYADYLVVRLENLIEGSATKVTKTVKIKFSTDDLSSNTSTQTGYVEFDFSNCEMVAASGK